MPTVETVRGPVELSDLGATLMHEHVFVLSTEHVQNYGDQWWDEEARVADAVAKLNALHAKGITTIVDPTVWGLGRNIPRIQRIAAQTPLNIVVATGLYVYEELPQQYVYRGPGLLLDVPEPLVTDFVRDIADGIAGTDVKAAFLKCCVEHYGLVDDIRTELLEPSETKTRCAYKGLASYWSFHHHDDVAWTYPDPDHDGRDIRDYICFFNERVDLEVDGVLQDRPRTQWSRDG